MTPETLRKLINVTVRKDDPGAWRLYQCAGPVGTDIAFIEGWLVGNEVWLVTIYLDNNGFAVYVPQVQSC